MKYIDSEKLITEIERRKNEYREFAQKRGYSCLGNSARIKAVEDEEILSIITSLQQEQPEAIEKIRTDAALIGFHLACGNGDKTIGECIELWKPIIIDSIKHERTEVDEVDLERELCEYYNKEEFGPSDAIEYETHKDIARHFWNKGYNARKEE